MSVLGCGAGRSSRSHSSITAVERFCPARAQGIVARFAGIRPAYRVGRDNGGAPECVFSAGRLAVVAAVDSAPQPYGVMERAVDEEAQMFTATRTTKPPQAVKHLGLDAYWFPQESHLMTTDGLRLITVTVRRWPGAGHRRVVALAAALARPYLGRLHPELAKTES